MSLKTIDDRLIGKRADVKWGGSDHHNSKDDWRTPPKLYNQIYHTFDLSFDPCPFPRPEWDGLKIKWDEYWDGCGEKGRVFVNPPYGKQTPFWLEKAQKEINEGRCEIAVFLIFNRSDTQWFKNYIIPKAQELFLIEGRVVFIRPDGSKGEQPSWPSVKVTFYKGRPFANHLIVESWSQKGE